MIVVWVNPLYIFLSNREIFRICPCLSPFCHHCAAWLNSLTVMNSSLSTSQIVWFMRLETGTSFDFINCAKRLANDVNSMFKIETSPFSTSNAEHISNPIYQSNTHLPSRLHPRLHSRPPTVFDWSTVSTPHIQSWHSAFERLDSSVPRRLQPCITTSNTRHVLVPEDLHTTTAIARLLPHHTSCRSESTRTQELQSRNSSPFCTTYIMWTGIK